MPYQSQKQQRYLESAASPLTEEQKQEFRAATDFSSLPNKVKTKRSIKQQRAIAVHMRKQFTNKITMPVGMKF